MVVSAGTSGTAPRQTRRSGSRESRSSTLAERSGPSKKIGTTSPRYGPSGASFMEDSNVGIFSFSARPKDRTVWSGHCDHIPRDTLVGKQAVLPGPRGREHESHREPRQASSRGDSASTRRTQDGMG